jgi:glycosyltransferase involved in cell wall biosynthesis
VSSTAPKLKVAACTIVAHNYVPMASVLAESLFEVHPEIVMHTIVIDHPALVVNLEIPHSLVLSIDQIDLKANNYPTQASIYDVTEFATSIKPFVLEQLLCDFDVVLYLDPDIQIFSSLASIINNTYEHGWSLTPHVTKPYKNRKAGPPEKEVMGAGIYNLGYIGVSRSSMSMLHWWQEHLSRDAIIDQSSQLFTDQRWIDLAVPIFRPYIEFGTSYNVAYWNLDHRVLAQNGENCFEVDGQPLVFFHFSGYDPDQPYIICKYQSNNSRVSMSDNPVYSQIFGSYARKLIEARNTFGNLPSYGWEECVPGIPLKRHVRRLLRAELIASDSGLCEIPPMPFISADVNRFFEWLRLASPLDHRPIPRHVLAHLQSLPYDNARLWDMHIRHVSKEYEQWFTHYLLPNDELSQFIGSKRVTKEINDSDISKSLILRKGVDVVGYLKAELGVGEAARRVVSALSAVGIETSISAVSAPESREEVSVALTNKLSHKVAIIAVNADQVEQVVSKIPHSRRRQKLIGQWFWELEDAPPWMPAAFQYLDEVWVANEFMAIAVRSVAPPMFPVRVVPLPLTIEKFDAPPAAPVVLDDRFTFGFVFDFLSVMKRKNPIGLVKAYINAFPEVGRSRLVIKTINAELRPVDREELLWTALGRKDITIVTDYWSSQEVLSFLKGIDCYVSLHRSEGLGLTIAEAMAQETPVIATGYSGNMSFMTEENSYLVPYKIGKVGADAGGYDPEAIWAEPDLETASKLMMRVMNDVAEAELKGVAGKEHLESFFSPQAVGLIMKEQLCRLGAL